MPTPPKLSSRSRLAGKPKSSRPERPRAALVRGQLAAKILLATRGAPELPARRFGDAAWRHEPDVVGRDTDALEESRFDGSCDARPRLGVVLAALGDDDQFFRPGRPVRDAESGDATAPHPVDFRDLLFDFLRHQVTAGADDDVFGAAGDEKLVVELERAITRIEIAVAAADGSRGVFHLVIAFHYGGSAKDERALASLRNFASTIVDDADLVP